MATRLKAVASKARQLQLRISLLDVVPLVWRSIVVPETITLPTLHVAILRAMGWDGGHLHEFVFASGRYGPSEPGWDQPEDWLPETRVKLSKALAYGISTFEYVYDFGDNWRHLVQIEDVLPPRTDADRSVRCVAGANACPPEDVGGVPGYADFVRSIANPNDEEHEQSLRWVGGSFDPRAFDLALANERLTDFKL